MLFKKEVANRIGLIYCNVYFKFLIQTFIVCCPENGANMAPYPSKPPIITITIAT